MLSSISCCCCSASVAAAAKVAAAAMGRSNRAAAVAGSSAVGCSADTTENRPTEGCSAPSTAAAAAVAAGVNAAGSGNGGRPANEKPAVAGSGSGGSCWERLRARLAPPEPSFSESATGSGRGCWNIASTSADASAQPCACRDACLPSVGISRASLSLQRGCREVPARRRRWCGHAAAWQAIEQAQPQQARHRPCELGHVVRPGSLRAARVGPGPALHSRVAAVLALADVGVAARPGVKALAILLQALGALAAAAALVALGGGDLRVGRGGSGRSELWMRKGHAGAHGPILLAGVQHKEQIACAWLKGRSAATGWACSEGARAGGDGLP